MGMTRNMIFHRVGKIMFAPLFRASVPELIAELDGHGEAVEQLFKPVGVAFSRGGCTVERALQNRLGGVGGPGGEGDVRGIFVLLFGHFPIPEGSVTRKNLTNARGARGFGGSGRVPVSGRPAVGRLRVHVFDASGVARGGGRCQEGGICEGGGDAGEGELGLGGEVLGGVVGEAVADGPLTEADKATNRRKSSVRSKVEHPFLTLKRFWGFAKARYRGLVKNANRAFAMLAMLNSNKWGRPLTGEGRPA